MIFSSSNFEYGIEPDWFAAVLKVYTPSGLENSCLSISVGLSDFGNSFSFSGTKPSYSLSVTPNV
jgi:hypothetical protein